MKLFKIICLCLLTSMLFGQRELDSTQKRMRTEGKYAREYNEGLYNVYKIDSIPQKGTQICKGWRVKYEDNFNFSKSNFDDSAWDTVSIDKKFADYPPIEKNKIGWFRKKIFVDSTIVGRPFIMKILITGAAEIYLNGKLIQEIGSVDTDEKKCKTIYYNIALPHSITFNKPGEQVFAVRFLFTPHHKIDDSFDFFPLSIRLQRLEGFMRRQLSQTMSDSLMDGICYGLFFMMAFIHFFFYYFFRSQKFNISFSISMLLFSIHFLINRGVIIYEDFDTYVYLKIIAKLIFLMAHIAQLNAMYEYLQYPKKLLFWGVVLTFLMGNFLIFFQLISPDFKILLYTFLISNYIFLIWKSIKNKTPNSKVMGDAAIIFVASFCSFMLLAMIYVAIEAVHNPMQMVKHNAILIPIAIILVAVGPQLSVSGAISFSLAKEFVKTNISLSQKLEEIEKLSQEKQHILSSQNEYLEKQVNERTAELNQSLESLKTTQNQLIQTEKLASLGELTAGIAHEIQNPLNFVNNFSELSVELIEELREERKKENGGRNEELENELLSDITQNLEKITHHGKRASSIVRGMLEHSRASSNVKELTDINALADEYLRLSYHGLRAKDKSFNAILKTNFDDKIEKVNIVPQDIGRVILNLITNAFYAVTEKKKEISHGYEPTVSVSSKKFNDKIELKIRDNGKGIPEKVLDKIFQPFFTTKPAGQGTGLGLSLSYDIVKAHGGELKVETKEGEFTEFIIILPQ